ncbi:MAG: D-2-hydroxyacid dehydrogenase family protein [Caldilineaceae bacterium]|nr:D-2-hydroxyacid dehydrogenase family protein [Caldilineaceae bacterium]
MLKIAILDDYAQVALQSADWSVLDGKAEITVFDRHLSEDEAAVALRPFDVLCTVRERMSLPRSLFERLPNLKLVTIIGTSLPNLDLAAATEHGVIVSHSSVGNPAHANTVNATPELTWGLMIATVRRFSYEDRRMRAGGWQSTVGMILAGRTLGLLGLGRIGQRVAAYGNVFGMKVIAWSQNLTEEAAAAVGAQRVEKDELFRRSDVLSIHVRLSERTRGLVTARELTLMKPEAYLINTSRGPIVVEADLIAALRAGRIAGAGLDVFDVEPLPADHPFRTMDNVTLTPHLGYVTRETLRAFYGDTLEAVQAFADGAPIRVANPQALTQA